MKKQLIILILLGFVVSAFAQKSKDVPVIDLHKALAD